MGWFCRLSSIYRRFIVDYRRFIEQNFSWSCRFFPKSGLVELNCIKIPQKITQDSFQKKVDIFITSISTRPKFNRSKWTWFGIRSNDLYRILTSDEMAIQKAKHQKLLIMILTSVYWTTIRSVTSHMHRTWFPFSVVKDGDFRKKSLIISSHFLTSYQKQ